MTTPAPREFARYALFYVPSPTAEWAQFATAWLGWDSVVGCKVAHPSLPDLPLPVTDITQTPRKYGLHGTIKPPFRLSPGTGLDDLETACAALCGTLRPVTLRRLRLTRLGRFLALCSDPSAALSDLAGACVRSLDPYRAALTLAELERRRNSHLSERQDAHLLKWGYPHVMEDFRFHITMTGRMADSAVQPVENALETALSPLLVEPVALSDLALMGEDVDGRFHLLRRFELTG